MILTSTPTGHRRHPRQRRLSRSDDDRMVRPFSLSPPSSQPHCADTHLRGQKFPPAKIEGAKSKAALKDLAEVEDVAEQVRSMVMNKGITGQNVVVDCGGVI